MSKRVLFVDDNALMRKVYMASCIPKYIGFAAATVPTALAYLEVVEIDCVVTDYLLGEEGGVDLLRHVRGRWPHIPVICVSGLRQSVTLGMDFDDVLLKPLREWNIVEEAIDRAIARREAS